MSDETGTDKQLDQALPLIPRAGSLLNSKQASCPPGTSKVKCVNFLTASAELSEELTLKADDIFIDNQGIVRFKDRTIVAVRKRSCVDAGRVRTMARALPDQAKIDALAAKRDADRALEADRIAAKASFSPAQIDSLQQPPSAGAELQTYGAGAVTGGAVWSAMEPLYAQPPDHKDSPNHENEIPPVAICPCDVSVETG